MYTPSRNLELQFLTARYLKAPPLSFSLFDYLSLLLIIIFYYYYFIIIIRFSEIFEYFNLTVEIIFPALVNDEKLFRGRATFSFGGTRNGEQTGRE